VNLCGNALSIRVRTPVKLTVPLLWPAEKPRDNLAQCRPNWPVKRA
jgi:hypothetical protein